MKNQCTFQWADSRTVTSETREKTAKIIRSVRKQGVVLRLRANDYRAMIRGYDVVAIIKTRKTQ